MGKHYDKIIRHKLVIDLVVKGDNSETRNGWEGMMDDKHIEKALRRILTRDGGQR